MENKESEKLGRENGVVLVCTNALISGDDLLVGCFMFTKFTPMSSFAGVPLVRCSCMPWSLLIARICADLAFCFLLSGCGSRSVVRFVDSGAGVSASPESCLLPEPPPPKHSAGNSYLNTFRRPIFTSSWGIWVPVGPHPTLQCIGSSAQAFPCCARRPLP